MKDQLEEWIVAFVWVASHNALTIGALQTEALRDASGDLAYWLSLRCDSIHAVATSDFAIRLAASDDYDRVANWLRLKLSR